MEEVIIKNSVTKVEKIVGFGFWISLFGGHPERIYKEIKSGVQCIKIIGVAFYQIEDMIEEITGLRGSVHPMRNGGRKLFRIKSIRISKQWVAPRSILKTELCDLGHIFQSIGPYFLDF